MARLKFSLLVASIAALKSSVFNLVASVSWVVISLFSSCVVISKGGADVGVDVAVPVVLVDGELLFAGAVPFVDGGSMVYEDNKMMPRNSKPCT